MRVYFAGPVCADGGTLVVCEGAPAGAGLEWSLDGGGALTPTDDHANEHGTGTAAYDPTAGTPALEGAEITVTVSAYA